MSRNVRGGTRTTRGGAHNSTLSTVTKVDPVEEELRSLRALAAETREALEAIDSGLNDLLMKNACTVQVDELEARVQVLENQEINTVRWVIPKAFKEVRPKYKQGQVLASPPFSLFGCTEPFVLHLYPQGDDFAEEGLMSLFLLGGPEGLEYERKLFAGSGKNRKVTPLLTGSKYGESDFGVIRMLTDERDNLLVGACDLKATSGIPKRDAIQLKSRVSPF